MIPTYIESNPASLSYLFKAVKIYHPFVAALERSFFRTLLEAPV